MTDKPIAKLYQELGRDLTDKVSISYVNDTTQWTSQQVAAKFADALAATLVEKELNVYMMVNPVAGIISGRGHANEVTALAAIWADLDVKPGGVNSWEDAVKITEMLSGILNCRPVAIVQSGHGYQPYWAVEDGDISDANRHYMMGLLKRWGQLVARMAEVVGGKVDSVYDLPRVLRAPGTINFKDPAHPVATTIEFTEWSRPLTVNEIDEELQAYGFLNADLTVDELVTIESIADWVPADRDCVWAAQLAQSVVNAPLNPKSRHSWLIGMATKINVAARNSCITEETYSELIQLTEQKFLEILAQPPGPRQPAPGEVSTAFAWAAKLVSTFSEPRMAENLNYHKHKAQLYAVPDLPKESGQSENVSIFPTSGSSALAPELAPIVLGDSSFQFTDAANAERLANAAKSEYIYVPGLGWHIWKDGRYVPDVARSIIRVAIATARQNAAESTHDRALEWAKKSMSGPLVATAVRLAESVPELVVMSTNLDASPLELCTPGGIVDLTTGTVHPAQPLVDLNTRQANFTPKAGPHPLFDAFLRQSLGDDERIDYMQLLAGVALIGEIRWHILPVFSGSGANGKSALLDIFGKTLGDYSAIMPENFLLDGGKVEHSTEIFRLRGVRLAIASETRPDGKFNESRVKMLTAEPVLSARAMRENFVDFPATHTLFLALNHPPQVRSGGDGFWRRIRKIDFNYQVPKADRNPNLAAEIVDAEGAAILAWMVEGAKRVLRDGLVEPASIEAATEQYRSEEDHISAWMGDMTTPNPYAEFTARQIYGNYASWCKDNSEHPIPATPFFRDLRQRLPIVPSKIGRERSWKGVHIAVDLEDD